MTNLDYLYNRDAARSTFDKNYFVNGQWTWGVGASYTPTEDIAYIPATIVYVPWGNIALERQKNFRRLLELLEVDADRLQPIDRPTLNSTC